MLRPKCVPTRAISGKLNRGVACSATLNDNGCKHVFYTFCRCAKLPTNRPCRAHAERPMWAVLLGPTRVPWPVILPSLPPGVYQGALARSPALFLLGAGVCATPATLWARAPATSLYRASASASKAGRTIHLVAPMSTCTRLFKSSEVKTPLDNTSNLHQRAAAKAIAKCIPLVAGATRLPYTAFLRMSRRAGATGPKSRPALHAVRVCGLHAIRGHGLEKASAGFRGLLWASARLNALMHSRPRTVASLHGPPCNSRPQTASAQTPDAFEADSIQFEATVRTNT